MILKKNNEQTKKVGGEQTKKKAVNKPVKEGSHNRVIFTFQRTAGWPTPTDQASTGRNPTNRTNKQLNSPPCRDPNLRFGKPGARARAPGPRSQVPVKQSKYAHVINAVSCEFDSHEQPDYDFFVTNKASNIFKDRYMLLFIRVYTCAKTLGLSTVVMSVVGGNAFASKYPGGLGNSRPRCGFLHSCV